MKRILALLIVLAVVVFTAQNAEVVEIQFLGWSWWMSRAVLVGLAVALGVLIGWLTPFGRRRPPAEPVTQTEGRSS